MVNEIWDISFASWIDLWVMKYEMNESRHTEWYIISFGVVPTLSLVIPRTDDSYRMNALSVKNVNKRLLKVKAVAYLLSLCVYSILVSYSYRLLFIHCSLKVVIIVIIVSKRNYFKKWVPGENDLWAMVWEFFKLTADN